MLSKLQKQKSNCSSKFKCDQQMDDFEQLEAGELGQAQQLAGDEPSHQEEEMADEVMSEANLCIDEAADAPLLTPEQMEAVECKS